MSILNNTADAMILGIIQLLPFGEIYVQRVAVRKFSPSADTEIHKWAS